MRTSLHGGHHHTGRGLFFLLIPFLLLRRGIFWLLLLAIPTFLWLTCQAGTITDATPTELTETERQEARAACQAAGKLPATTVQDLGAHRAYVTLRSYGLRGECLTQLGKVQDVKVTHHTERY